MTEKEKAEELFSKCHVEIMDFDITDVVLEDTAKQLALIAVNEILLEYKKYDKLTMMQYDNMVINKKIKQEIEKL